MTQTDLKRRRQPRYTVNLPSQISWNDRRMDCRLVNVSSSGALLETKIEATIGDQIEMDLPDGESMLGKIVRITSTHIALSFPGVLVVSPLLEQAQASGSA